MPRYPHDLENLYLLKLEVLEVLGRRIKIGINNPPTKVIVYCHDQAELDAMPHRHFADRPVKFVLDPDPGPADAYNQTTATSHP